MKLVLISLIKTKINCGAFSFTNKLVIEKTLFQWKMFRFDYNFHMDTYNSIEHCYVGQILLEFHVIVFTLMCSSSRMVLFIFSAIIVALLCSVAAAICQGSGNSILSEMAPSSSLSGQGVPSILGQLVYWCTICRNTL